MARVSFSPVVSLLGGCFLIWENWDEKPSLAVRLRGIDWAARCKGLARSRESERRPGFFPGFSFRELLLSQRLLPLQGLYLPYAAVVHADSMACVLCSLLTRGLCLNKGLNKY